MQTVHAPLEALAGRFVTRVSRTALGGAVTGKLGFDLGEHPSARSKVARDMLARIGTDAREFAEQHNTGSAARCAFVPDADALVGGADGGAARAAAEAATAELVELLSSRREGDAALVQEALPLILERVNALRKACCAKGPRKDKKTYFFPTS